MKLVGKRRPDAFTVDPRSPLDLQQIAGEPSLLDGLAHLRIARVQPVPGPVEGKSFDHFGAAKSAQAILRLEQRARLPQLEGARKSGESAADDDGSPTPPHRHHACTTKRRGRFVGGRWIPMLAWPRYQCASSTLRSTPREDLLPKLRRRLRAGRSAGLTLRPQHQVPEVQEAVHGASAEKRSGQAGREARRSASGPSRREGSGLEARRREARKARASRSRPPSRNERR